MSHAVRTVSDPLTTSPRRRWVAWLLIGVGLLIPAGFAIGAATGDGKRAPDPGSLGEIQFSRPDEVPLPELDESTHRWGLSGLGGGRNPTEMAGGLAAVDLDGDGDLELVVASGSVQVLAWEGEGFGMARDLGIDGAMAVTSSDVDLDGLADLLVSTSSGTDIVVWGGSWLASGEEPALTELVGDWSGASTGLLAGELTGDGLMDIVRLGTSDRDREALWVGAPERSFELTEFGEEAARTLAGELVDADGDGTLDIWLTRDLGWRDGGDAVYSRVVGGNWDDIAAQVGADLEIDGMGLTFADLDGRPGLDAYVSDIGDNEVLVRSGDNFVRSRGTGLARIRPRGSPEDVVSSSWASGAVDINLDGRMDVVVANGGFPLGKLINKIPGTEVAVNDPLGIMLGLGGGRFVDVWAEMGLDWSGAGRGLVVADLDDDGDDDVVVVDVDGRLSAFENLSSRSSIKITSAVGCPVAGVEVSVRNSTGSFAKLLAPHTFAGSHGASVIAGGVRDGEAIEVTWGRAGSSDQVIRVVGEPRERVVLACPNG